MTRGHYFLSLFFLFRPNETVQHVQHLFWLFFICCCLPADIYCLSSPSSSAFSIFCCCCCLLLLLPLFSLLFPPIGTVQVAREDKLVGGDGDHLKFARGSGYIQSHSSKLSLHNFLLIYMVICQGPSSLILPN